MTTFSSFIDLLKSVLRVEEKKVSQWFLFTTKWELLTTPVAFFPLLPLPSPLLPHATVTLVQFLFLKHVRLISSFLGIVTLLRLEVGDIFFESMWLSSAQMSFPQHLACEH